MKDGGQTVHANGNWEHSWGSKHLCKTKCILKQKTVHNNKKENPMRGYNICKYLCTNRGAVKHIKQIVRYLKGEIDKKPLQWTLLNLLTSVNKSSGQKFNKVILTLNNTLHQMS